MLLTCAYKAKSIDIIDMSTFIPHVEYSLKKKAPKFLIHFKIGKIECGEQQKYHTPKIIYEIGKFKWPVSFASDLMKKNIIIAVFSKIFDISI